MKVKELIEILKDLNPDMESKHCSYEHLEYAEVGDIGIVEDEGIKCYVIY